MVIVIVIITTLISALHLATRLLPSSLPSNLSRVQQASAPPTGLLYLEQIKRIYNLHADSKSMLANSDVPVHCAWCSDGMRRKYEGKVNMKSPQPGMPASADHTRHVQWKAAWGGRGDQRDGQDVRWIGRGVCIDVTVDVHEVSMTMYHIIVESIYTYYIYHTCIYMYYCHQVINILLRQKTSYLTWTRHSKELFLRNDAL